MANGRNQGSTSTKALLRGPRGAKTSRDPPGRVLFIGAAHKAFNAHNIAIHIGTPARAFCRTAAKTRAGDPPVAFEQHSERPCYRQNGGVMLSAQQMPPTAGIA